MISPSSSYNTINDEVESEKEHIQNLLACGVGQIKILSFETRDVLKVNTSQVAGHRIWEYGTLLQHAAHKGKTEFSKILLEFG